MGCYSHFFHSGAGNPRDPDLLRLHGGTFRTVYPGEPSLKGPDDAATHLLAARRWQTRRHYFTPEFGDQLEKAIRAWIAERRADQDDERDALDQWYIENRNRYHFGITWRARLL